MQRSHLVAFIILVVLGGVAFLFSRTLLKVPEKTQEPKVFSNAYSLLLQDLNGKEVHLYEYRRKVLIAYTWASWCPYCGDELKNLARLRQTYGDEIEIVAINRGEQTAEAKNYVNRLSAEATDFNITVLLDFLLDKDDAFFKTISGYAMPETVFINENGDIVFHQRGPIKIDEVDQKIKELLK
jgi:thiol-disulfide isomerase/thioredoxin